MSRTMPARCSLNPSNSSHKNIGHCLQFGTKLYCVQTLVQEFIMSISRKPDEFSECLIAMVKECLKLGCYLGWPRRFVKHMVIRPIIAHDRFNRTQDFQLLGWRLFFTVQKIQEILS